MSSPFTYATVCSGIECMSAAVGPLGGWKPVFFSEIEAFPCALLQHHYPAVPNLGDMTKIKAEKTGEDAWRVTNGDKVIELDHRLGVLAGGTPCFTAGTLILTSRGYKPIEDVEFGDYVLTGRHRLCKVVRTGSKVAYDIVDAEIPYRGAIRSTATHPYMLTRKPKDGDSFPEPEAMPIGNGKGRWGYRVDASLIPWTEPPMTPNLSIAPLEAVMGLAGWYLGAGSFDDLGRRGGNVKLTLDEERTRKFREMFGDTFRHGIDVRGEKTYIRVAYLGIVQFFTTQFNIGSHKAIPLWVYTLPEAMKRNLLKGYLAASGETAGLWTSDISRRAVELSLADMFPQLLAVDTRYEDRVTKGGRTITFVSSRLRRRDWKFKEVATPHGTAFRIGGVKASIARAKVYNIEVERDHTYAANGIIVHNCQDVSVAGKRAGMAEGSGTRSSLAFHLARLCRELQPRWIVYENVCGVLTSNGGKDFAHFIEKIRECGYSLAYRTLDAQYVRVDGLPRAVPQRRRRVWLVGHLGEDWRPPCEVLFEPEGVRGDTPPRRVTGKGFTGEAGGGAEGSDRPAGTNSNGEDVMPTITAVDLAKRMTGQADTGGGYVLSPSGFDPYEPGGVKSATEEVSGTVVNGSSPGFHNAVCFENHQSGNHKHVVAEVAPTMGASRNAQAANNNPLVVTERPEIFGKVGHAVNKAGDNERYESIEVAETRNTFANGEVRAQEVVVSPEVVAIDMDKNKPSNGDKPVRRGGAGFGVSEKGAAYTLNAHDQHAVAYAFDSLGSNAMKSKNPHSGCREIECAPTLTTVDSAPMKHQGGTAVVAFLPGNSAKAQGLGAEEEVSPTLARTQGESGNKIAVAGECIGVFDMEAGKSGARAETGGVSPTLLALHGTDPHAVCIGFDAQMGKMNTSPKDNLSETLATAHQCGVAVGFHAHLGTHGESPNEEVSSTLATGHKCGVAIGLDRAAYNQSDNAKFAPDIREECSPTIISRGPGAVSFEPGLARREGNDNRFVEEATTTLRAKMGDNQPAVATMDYIVRRLTPLEAERLQGLPDGYTKIPYRGKPADECPDTPRYKALGNGWAVNCARWICQRIQNYDKDHAKE